ncbi:hypothetical protein A6R68_21595 [Neotoma lepida]|uniref:Uncharacterized protein n=1 Tax=Neotoma lepida TaxID=56216 RepID=A0A1A6HP36_NEOLE|nr:hypothetical protein A6R68_21595 [Neotoma lepida]
MEFVFSVTVSECGHSAFCPLFMLRNLSFQLPSSDGALSFFSQACPSHPRARKMQESLEPPF